MKDKHSDTTLAKRGSTITTHLPVREGGRGIWRRGFWRRGKKDWRRWEGYTRNRTPWRRMSSVSV